MHIHTKLKKTNKKQKHINIVKGYRVAYPNILYNICYVYIYYIIYNV